MVNEGSGRKMKKQNVRTLSLIVCEFTYLLVGAAVFDALESEFERETKADLEAKEFAIMKKYNMSQEDFNNLTKIIIKSEPHKAGIQWKFSGAFYFAVTVITTIGYGHSTPKTVAGKIFCMLYALGGIPMTLVMFQSIGERLNSFVTFVLKHVKICFKLKNREVSQTNLIIVSLNMCIFVLTGGAAAFTFFEGWQYIDSFYYCFITLTTIGFGDYVALQRTKALQKQPEYVAFSLIFILFGLAVLSTATNLLVLRFLTMNTEDERREQIEAAIAARGAVTIDGDIITSNGGGNIVHAHNEDNPEFADLTSVCSCSCYNFCSRFRGHKQKYMYATQPKNVSQKNGQLLGVHLRDEMSDEEDTASSVMCYSSLSQKRASI